MKYYRNDKRIRYRKYFLISLAVIAFAALLWGGYSYLKRLKDPVVPAIKAIPESTICLIKIGNTLSLWSRIDEKNQIWKELKNLSFINELHSNIQRIDTLAKKNEAIAEIFSKNPLYIAWVPDRDEYHYLFAINLNGPHNERLVDDFMHKNFSSGNIFTVRRFLENEIFEVHRAGKTLCAYTVYKGIFIIAETSGVVETSLSALLTEICIENNTDYIRLNASAGKNVDANIFIKNTYLDNLISRFFSPKQTDNLKLLSLSGDMISLDLTIKNDELIFAGFALSGDPGQMLTRVFIGQPPQPIELTAICPSNTAVMAFWGVKNALAYARNYKDFIGVNFHKKSFSQTCSYYDTTYNTGFSENFLQQIGNQFACIITENPNIDKPYRYYGIFKARNIEEFQEALKKISTVPEESSFAQRDSFAIRKLKPENFLMDFFGGIFENLDTAYYTTIKDYIVFGDSPLSLDLFVSGYLSGKTLEKNPNYISFSDNVSDEANFCLYTNIRKSFRLLLPLYNKDLAAAFSTNESSLKNIQALAFQLSANKNRFYLNAYARHNSAYIEENPAVWEFVADTVISGKISIIKDPVDSMQKILFYDKKDNLYLINRNGQLIWKKHIKDHPLSKVFLITLKTDNKPYLIFNTKNQIYIFDLNGKMPEYCPLDLPYPASTAITLSDYSGNKDYRIIIPCENQKIYNYQVNGKPTTGWNNFRTDAVLKSSVEYFRFRNKDILIATDKNGKVYFISRKGNLLVKNVQPFIRAKHSRFFRHNIQQKQYLVTTDRKGKIIFISENGKIEVVTLRPFSENHYFLMGDFNKDNKDDFIFFDQGKVFVYNHDKKKIFEDYMNGLPAASPVYVRINKNKFQIIFPDKDCSHLYFLDETGIHEIKNYTLNNPDFETGTLFGANFSNIIVADSNVLLNYIID